MTKDEIIEFNKIIVKFKPKSTGLGSSQDFGDNIPDWYAKKLIYHRSWAWLMPVIEKIELIADVQNGKFVVFIHDNVCTIQGSKLDTRPETFHEAYLSNPDAIFPTKIESTWYNVVQFIQWYNQQPK